MQVGFRIGPVPLRDDDVALDALRTRRRLGGQFAVRDTGGPIGKLRQRAFRAKLVTGGGQISVRTINGGIRLVVQRPGV